uniref:Uncharacterized protein n=1 Tax=Biomphalaria glabrata TaxID=6526 RepID=A0A2C9KVS4_BIOGL
MLAKWQIILNPLVNQHTGHPNVLFPSCLHGTEYNTENKDWFEPGTDNYESVCKILDHCKLEKDIKKLSPTYQTAALESFHSLVIKFAPKHTAFSYLGMRSRLHIAAMHYKENCGEKTDDTDEEGNVQCNIIFSKYKKGDYNIKKQKKTSTQVYVHRLMNYLFDEFRNEFRKDPKELTKSLTEYVDQNLNGHHGTI